MRFRAPERLAHVVEDDGDAPVVYLCPLPEGPPTAVSGSAAVIWLSAVDGEGDVVASVASAFEVEEEAIRQDVEGYLAYLLDAGFLEEQP